MPGGSAALGRLRGLARLLDTAVRVPGTRIRFGLDPILGIVPGLGDAIGFALGGWIIVEAARLGAPLPVLLRMLAHSLLDAITGSVPVAGTLVDVFLRPNKRNVMLLEEWITTPAAATGRSRRMVWLVAGTLLGLVALAFVLGVVLLLAVVRVLVGA